LIAHYAARAAEYDEVYWKQSAPTRMCPPPLSESCRTVPLTRLMSA